MTRGTLATGEKVRQREVDTCSQLTPQEEHIVRLARTAALFTHDLQTRGPLELDLAHGDRVARYQADQTAPSLIPRPGIESQRDVKVKLPEPHQPGAALRLLDQRAELLVRSACLQVAEQRPGVRP